jgi:hypothetical protein
MSDVSAKARCEIIFRRFQSRDACCDCIRAQDSYSIRTPVIAYWLFHLLLAFASTALCAEQFARVTKGADARLGSIERNKLADLTLIDGNPLADIDAMRNVRAVMLDGHAVYTNSTVLGVSGAKFAVNGKPTFLYGLSYYGALAARDEFIRRDLDEAQTNGFNWIRVWANWRGFDAEAAAVDGEGRAIPAGIEKLKRLIADCDRRGMIVDVTLSRGNGVTGSPRLQTLAAHERAVETLVNALKPHRNWYLDLSNERNIQDTRFTSIADLKRLRDLAKKLDPELLITASHSPDITRDELREYIETVRVDFISPHRPRGAKSAAETAGKTKQYLEWSRGLGREVPVHYQEPFRHGYTRGWNPLADDFVRDALAARDGGAAGWCFHNGDERGSSDGKPRRSFDLREKRLFEQLDAEELRAIAALKVNFAKK